MASDAARKDARERSLGGAALRLLALLALAAVVIRTRVVLAAARVGDAVVVIGGQGALERRGDVDVLVLPERKEIIAPMAGSGVLSVVAQLQLEVGA